MDFILYSAVLLIVAILIFLSIERPYIFAFLMLFMLCYRRTNLELPGPLDARGLMTIVLFARLFLFDKQNFNLVKRFLFQDLTSLLLLIFIIAGFYTTYSNFGGLIAQLKYSFLLIVSLILGFIIMINGQGRKVFYNAILLAALLSIIDLIYTFIFYGNLDIRSLFKTILLHDHSIVNQNDVGLLCGYALIMTFIFNIRQQLNRAISIPLMLLLGLGILLSTSRSTLIAVVPVLIIISLVQREIQFNIKKVMTAFLGTALFLVSFYFIYNALLTSGEFKSSFVDKAYYRLYEEPMSLIGGNDQKVFNQYGKAQEGTTRWRLNRSMKDLVKYSRLDLKTELWGLGEGGYVIKDFAEDYNLVHPISSHNGYILILVERGIIGLLLFILVIVNLSIKSFKLLRQRSISLPIIYVLLTLVFYAIGQNAELTQTLAFTLLGAAIASTKETLVSEYQAENNPDISSVPETDNQIIHNEKHFINLNKNYTTFKNPTK